MRRTTVLLAASMNSFLGGSLGYSAGIIHLGLLEKYKESPVAVSWAGALFSSFLCLAGPISSAVINATSCQKAIFLGSFLSSVGFLISSFVSDIELVILSYGIIAGIGQSLTYAGCVVVTGFYFQDNPSVATGVVAAGAGIGVTVYPIFTEFLMATYGVNGTFLLLSAVSLQTCVFTMCIKTHVLERKRRDGSNTISDKVKLILRELRKITSNGAYCCFCVSIFCWSASINTSVLFLPQYYVSTGSTPLQAALFMSVYGITGCLSRILTGLAASDINVDGKILYMGSYLILGIFTIFLPLLGTTFSGKMLYSVILGIYSSGVWSLLTPITMEIIDIKSLSTAFGIELLTSGIGFLSGPIIGDGVQRGSGSFSLVFVTSGVLYIMAGVFEVMMILKMKKSDFHKERRDEIRIIKAADKDTHEQGRKENQVHFEAPTQDDDSEMCTNIECRGLTEDQD